VLPRHSGDEKMRDLPTGRIDCAPSNTTRTWRPVSHDHFGGAKMGTYWASCPFATVIENWSSMDCPNIIYTWGVQVR
jgi:hypothetical protein